MKILPLLLLLLSFPACTPPKQEIKGEIFIATQGGLNFKLGAVGVKLHKKTNAEMLRIDRQQLLQELPYQSTTTDSEGKFSFNVPSGEYVVTAVASRHIIQDVEFYSWVIPIDVRKNGASVTLNNQNQEK